MKIAITVLLALLQFPSMGQLNIWQKDAIIKNQIKTLKVYVRVPKSNPEHPLMLLRQYSFDSDGRLIKEVCKACSGWIGGPKIDVIQELFYERDRLIQIDRTGLEKTATHFFYDNNKQLGITEDDHNKMVGIKLAYLDSQSKDTLAYEVTFSNPYTIKDSVHGVHLSKEVTKYDGQRIVTELYTSRDFVRFNEAVHISIFEELFLSRSPTEIERTLLSLNFEVSGAGGNRYVRERKNQTIEIRDLSDDEIVAICNLNEKGLVTEQERFTATNNLRLEYIYEVFD